jgi:hypothetical protein
MLHNEAGRSTDSPDFVSAAVFICAPGGRSAEKTTKRLQNLAYLFAGSYREAVIRDSPGLQPASALGQPVESGALKVAPDLCATGAIDTPRSEHTPRPPLSGQLGSFQLGAKYSLLAFRISTRVEDVVL